MPSHIALLRAVNVGKRQVRMEALRGWLTEAGFTDVETHIQSGNVKVRSSRRSSARVGAELERVIAEHTGFEVPCIMLTPAELTRVREDAEALEAPELAGLPEQRRYVVFLKEDVPAEQAAEISAYATSTERAWAIGRTVHLWIAGRMQDARAFGALGKALAPGTNRDLKVVRALDDRWGAGR